MEDREGNKQAEEKLKAQEMENRETKRNEKIIQISMSKRLMANRRIRPNIKAK